MNRIDLQGELNLARSAQLLALLDTEFSAKTLTLDFAGVSQVDSSAVALLLEWQRRANRAQCQLILTRLPSSLQQLIAVYGLQQLLLAEKSPSTDE